MGLGTAIPRQVAGPRAEQYLHLRPIAFVGVALKLEDGVERSKMMKNIFSLMFMVALVGLPAFAQKDENNRIQNAGKVMAEILNIPDDIPEDLLDKAQCVIVLPSVMKFAIGLGGSYGRGDNVLPERQEFQRTLERAFHDGARRWKLRRAVGRPSDRLRLIGNESARG